jgi:hypothetical protein
MEVKEIALIAAMVVTLGLAFRFSLVRRVREYLWFPDRSEADQQSSGSPEEARRRSD